MAFAIDGLASGLDTTNMINQLMQLEARPQALLKSKVSATQTLVSALQQLNSRVASLGELAKKSAETDALDLFSATSSSEKVSIKAGAGAVEGSVDISVEQIAKAQVSVSALMRTWPEDATVLTIASQDGMVDVDTTGKSLDQVVAAINESGAGVSAMKIAAGKDPDTGQQQYRLQLSATETGAAGGFGISLTKSDGSSTDLLAETGAVQIQAAQDAVVKLWSASDAEQSITSSSNTFSELLPGVEMTVTEALADPVTISISRDDEAVSNQVKELVGGLDGLFSFISTNSSVSTSTSSGSTVSKGGTFTGDSSVRDIEQRIMRAATSPVDGRSPSEIGISITKNGTVEFDAEKFAKALEEDPARTEKVVQEIASRVSTAATEASDKYDGAITLRIQGQESLVRELNTQVTEWDRRLEMRRSTLERTWSALEVTLSNLQAQGDYLTSQLSSLPSFGGTKK